MEDKLFYIGQKAIINKGGQILVLHDPVIDKIDLPGGKIQIGEVDFTAALRREVSEETGLTVKIGKPCATSFFEFKPGSNHRNKGKQIYLVIFDCQYVSGEVKLSEEHDRFYWVNKNNYGEYIHSGNIREIIAGYFGSQPDPDRSDDESDPLITDVYDYLTKFDFPLAYVIQKKFKIGISRAEKILKSIGRKKQHLKK